MLQNVDPNPHPTVAALTHITSAETRPTWGRCIISSSNPRRILMNQNRFIFCQHQIPLCRHSIYDLRSVRFQFNTQSCCTGDIPAYGPSYARYATEAETQPSGSRQIALRTQIEQIAWMRLKPAKKAARQLDVQQVRSKLVLGGSRTWKMLC